MRGILGCQRDHSSLLLASSSAWSCVGDAPRSAGAFARSVRDGRLTSEERVKAIRLLAQLLSGWDEILPNEKVRSLAEDPPDSHLLRAGDAAQLAAALVWCRERPKQRPLVAFDDRLGTAATALGFSVRP
jgi:hypothetical protein